MGEEEIIQYQPKGTCSRALGVGIQDGRITRAEFLGGCQGNLTGICQLIKGMEVDDVIERLQGINCGGKGTSCPDQLAQCLIEYKSRNAVTQ